MRQLTSLDMNFLAAEDGRMFGHVSGLTIYDPSTVPEGAFTLQRVIDTLSERLHLLPPFRWHLANVPLGLDLPFWVDDPYFDLEYHVRELALPAPGTKEQLADQVARIHARGLDRSRPLWELYVIHGLDDGNVAVLTKIHHAAIDGMSGAEILTVLLDTSPEGREIPAPDARPKGDPEPTQVELLGRGLAGLAMQPLRMARAGVRTLPVLDAIPGARDIPGVREISRLTRRLPGVSRPKVDGRVLESPKERAPRTVFSGPISGHRRVSFGTLSLSEVKQIKNAFGVTVNDVVVATVAGALRNWLLEHAELPDEPLLAMIPVSTRAKHEFGTYGNRVSMMVAAIPTDEPDPERRLRRVNEAMRGAKEHHRAIPASILQDATQFIPPAIFGRAARATLGIVARAGVTPPMNVIISNVPGSPAPLYMAGARLVAQYPISAIAHGVGLNITVLSYQDQLDWGIVGDRDQIDDAWPLMEAIEAEQATLLALAAPAKPAKAAKAAAAAKTTATAAEKTPKTVTP